MVILPTLIIYTSSHLLLMLKCQLPRAILYLLDWIVISTLSFNENVFLNPWSRTVIALVSILNGKSEPGRALFQAISISFAVCRIDVNPTI